MIVKRTYRILAVLWTLCVIAGLSIPGQDLPQTSLLQFDKLIHVGIFVVFAWLWMRAIDSITRMRAGGVFAFGVIFAIMTEIYQGMLPFERSPDPLDAMADTVGILIGIALFYLLPGRVRH